MGNDVFLIIFESLCDIITFRCNHILHDLKFNGLFFLDWNFAFRFIGLLFLGTLVVVKDIVIMALELEFDQSLDFVIVFR